MVKKNTFRSKSASATPYMQVAARGKHAQMNDLIKEDDRKALSMNKYEE